MSERLANAFRTHFSVNDGRAYCAPTENESRLAARGKRVDQTWSRYKATLDAIGSGVDVNADALMPLLVELITAHEKGILGERWAYNEKEKLNTIRAELLEHAEDGGSGTAQAIDAYVETRFGGWDAEA